MLVVAVGTLLWGPCGTFWSPRANYSYSWGTCVFTVLEVQLRSVCLWLPKPFHLLLCCPPKAALSALWACVRSSAGRSIAGATSNSWAQEALLFQPPMCLALQACAPCLADTVVCPQETLRLCFSSAYFNPFPVRLGSLWTKWDLRCNPKSYYFNF